MKLTEIWCEGDPQRDMTACHLGYGKGLDFLAACENLANNNSYFDEHFMRSNMTYKGCSLFNNESDARKLYN